MAHVPVVLTATFGMFLRRASVELVFKLIARRSCCLHNVRLGSSARDSVSLAIQGVGAFRRSVVAETLGEISHH